MDAGKSNRLLKGFPVTQRQINSLIRSYGKTVLARSRYLCANDAQMASAKESWKSALVGRGIQPMPLTKDKALKQELRELWRDWTDEADADGLVDLYGQQGLGANELFEAGEFFIRFRARRSSDGLSVPLQLQLLPSEMLPVDLNRVNGDGTSIQCGIEFNAIGQRTAYHFYRNHPNSDLRPAQGSLYTVVPAEEILHVFIPAAVGQIRGLPRSLSMMVTAAIRKQYMLGELARVNIASAFAAFITRQAPEDPQGGPLSGQKADATDDGVDNGIALEAGSISELAEGEDIKFSTPPQVSQTFEQFMYAVHTEMAAGAGVPYAGMTGDLRQTSYGSQRGGMLEQRRRIEPMQDILVFQMLRPVWNRWLREAVLADALPLSATQYLARQRELQRVEWIPPKMDWIDPLKDTQAEVLAIDNGLKARSDTIQATGRNPEEVDQRRLEDQQREADLGIVRPQSKGTTPPKDGPADPSNPNDPNAEQQDQQFADTGQGKDQNGGPGNGA